MRAGVRGMRERLKRRVGVSGRVRMRIWMRIEEVVGVRVCPSIDR